ncbi:MAG: hypothetical protein WCA16_11715 [Candidatus Sulfotelmatobacter sp.]
MKVKNRSAKNPAVSVRLKSAIKELRALHRLLRCDDVDPRVLGDFRDALNRIRNTAWAAQQAAANKLLDQGPTSMASLLASERVRAAYQLCRSIREDLEGDNIQFQKGQLTELYAVATQLTGRLQERL